MNNSVNIKVKSKRTGHGYSSETLKKQLVEFSKQYAKDTAKEIAERWMKEMKSDQSK